jgi:hypothetical protein
MADILATLAGSYVSVGSSTRSASKYVDVDKSLFEGAWSGKYADNTRFTLTVSNVDGFRAKVRYQSGSTVKYQDVLIRDNSFRVGDTKFALTKQGTAQIRTVVTDPATGASSLETAYAKQG